MSGHLNLETWPRRQQFHFFKDFQQPCFNMCSDVDVTALISCCKAGRHSYFLACLYLSIRAANEVPAFRYRMREQGVWEHDLIHPGSTVLNLDKTFGFCCFNYHHSSRKFMAEGRMALDAYHLNEGMHAQEDRDDMIHYSVIPWISFSSFSHARKGHERDSIPKIVFGKYRLQGDRWLMPCSVEVHHALMDGYHMGLYFQRFQDLLDQAESLMGS